MQFLLSYERNMSSAMNYGAIYNPGREALQKMAEIYQKHTNTILRVNPICGRCIGDVLKKIGQLYFATKAEKGKQNDLQPAKPVRQKAIRAKGKKSSK